AEGEGSRGVERLWVQGERRDLVRPRRGAWRDRVHRLLGGRRRGRGPGDRQERPAGRSRGDRRNGRRPAQPNTVLRRERRSDWRHWRTYHTQRLRRRG